MIACGLCCASDHLSNAGRLFPGRAGASAPFVLAQPAAKETSTVSRPLPPSLYAGTAPPPPCQRRHGRCGGQINPGLKLALAELEAALACEGDER